jgi:hypothetical protein
LATVETRSRSCSVTHTMPIDARSTGNPSKVRNFALLYFTAPGLNVLVHARKYA